MIESQYDEVYNFTFPWFRVFFVLSVLIIFKLIWLFFLDENRISKLACRVINSFYIFVLLIFILGALALYDKTQYIVDGNYSVADGLVHVESKNYEDIVFSVGSKKFTLFGGDFLLTFSKSEDFDVMDGMCLKVYYHENDILKIFHDDSSSCNKS